MNLPDKVAMTKPSVNGFDKFLKLYSYSAVCYKAFYRCVYITELRVIYISCKNGIKFCLPCIGDEYDNMEFEKEAEVFFHG